MNSVFKKTLLAVAAGASLMSVTGTAMSAAVFPDFTVNASAYGGSSSFTADKITGNYSEVITFDGLGNFAISIKWNAGQFVANDGNDPLANSGFGGGANTGLNNTYAMYGLFQSSGTVTAIDATHFTFNVGSGGSLGVFIDKNGDTTFAAPATGNLAYTLASNGDDVSIATGLGVSGSGTLNTSCSGGINCGSFGQTTTFELTDDGKLFFTAPAPFYQFSLQSGQLNSFEVTGTQTINGSMDVIFAVPEPTTLALLGLSLVGIGATAGRRKAV